MDDRSLSDRGSFTIGALSRHTGCSIDTIRYYERIDLMPKAGRTSGGHRVFGAEHIRRLNFIRSSRALGLSIDQVRGILGAIDRRACGCSEVMELLGRCAEETRRRVAELQALERNLRRMMDACGDAGLANCRLIEAMLAGEAKRPSGNCCATGRSAAIQQA